MTTKSTLTKPPNARALFALFALLAAPSAFGQSTDTWVGGTDNNFSTLANWTYSSGSGPVASGDSLTFGAAGFNTPNNDESSFIFNAITFNGTAQAYTIGGNAFTLGTSTAATSLTTTAGGANGQIINNNITLGAAVQTLSIAANANLTLGGNLSGTSAASGLTKTGAGALTLSGANTYAGPTVVSAGTLTNLETTGSTASTATWVVGNSSTKAKLQIGAGANFSAYNLAIAGVSSGLAAVWQTGGTVTLASAAGTAGGVADFAIDGPTANAGASGASGYYNLSGGSMNANSLTMNEGGNTSTAYGVVDITGGTLSLTNFLTLTRGGSGGWHDYSVFNVLGGSVTAGEVYQGNSYYPNIFTVGGGSGAASVTTAASTTNGYDMDFNGSNDGDSGYPCAGNLLANGTLQVGIVTASHNNNSHAKDTFFSFNGGTLKATSPNAGASFLTSANIGAVNVYGNGGTIDNDGTSITIGKALLATTGTGVTGVTLNNLGAGYIGAPLVQVTGGTATSASPDNGQSVATAIAIMAPDGSGNGTYEVSSILITSPGSYSSAPTGLSFTGGGATTSTTVTSIQSAANTAGGMTFQGSGTTTLTAANTYTGNTTITGGTLALSGSGSLASANINILASSAIFDVSAISYTLAAGKTLSGIGTVNGSVATAAGSSIYTESNGTVGTLTFNNNLNMSGGGNAYFDLSTTPSPSSLNDEVVVGGSLTLSSSDTITINPITASTLSTSDYVLFAVTGSITINSAPTLAWGTSTPAGANFYTIAKVGNNVVLHYSATPVVGTTAFTPVSPVYAGTPVTAGAAVGGGTPGYTYQWQSSPDDSTWSPILNATSSTYSPSTASAGTTYYRLVATDSNSQVGTGTGAALVVNAASAPIIGAAPVITPTPVNQGDNVSMAINTSAISGTLPVTGYQWQFSSNGGATWTSIYGATSSSYAINGVQPANVGEYQVIVSNGVGSTPSSAATLTLASGVIFTDHGSTAPTPGANDISQLSEVGNTGSPGGLNYYDNASPPAGETFTTSTNIDGYFLNKVYIQYGTVNESRGSGATFTLRIFSISGSTATLLGTYPNINAAPATALGDWCELSGMTNLLAANTTYGYTWSCSSGYEQMGNASGQPYTGGSICQIPTAGGTVTYGSPATFNATFLVGLSGLSNPLTITTNPLSATSALTASTNFTVAATSDGTLSYQWYAGTPGSGTLITEGSTDGAGTTFSDVTSATLNLSNIGAGDNNSTYYCAVTSTFGGGITQDSTAATLTVLALPTVGTTVFSPVSPVYGGTPVTASAAVGGGTPGYTYQWQSSPDDSTWSPILNATSSTYSPSTASAGTTYYRLVVTDSNAQVGTGTGAALVVTTASAPIITGLTITPTNVNQGGNVNMTASYAGTLPFTSYQWQFSPDGITWVNVSPSGTGSSYSITDAQPNQSGYYQVIVANSVGSTTSSPPATLTVATILINPSTLNGSFEYTSTGPTYGTGPAVFDGITGGEKAGFSSADSGAGYGPVPSWAEWTSALGGPSTADNDSGVQSVPADASQGNNVAYLQGGNAEYDLTAYTIAAGDTYTYTWDWVAIGRGTANVELAYWNGTTLTGIPATETSAQSNTAQVLGTTYTWTVTNGDPSIGSQMAITVAAPASANYPEVDNFVLTVIPGQVVITPPVAGPSFTLGAAIGIPVTVQIVGGKYAPTDSSGDPLTITSVTGATNGTVTTDGTNVTYTATNGTADSFTYTVSDPYGATASQTILVSISNATGQSYNQISGQLIGGLEVLQFAGIPGYQYALDWTQNLTPPVTWTPLTTNTASLSNGSLFFTNTPSGGNDYYRTRYVP